MPDDGTLGVIAGAGSLPRLIIAEAVRQRRPVFAVGFHDHTDPAALAGIPHLLTRPGKAGTVIKALHRATVRDVVLAGGLRRPSFAELRPDLYAARFLARIGRSALGDDGLLRAVIALLEREGFRVVGAADLVGALTVQAGNLGAVSPSEAHLRDVELGVRVVTTLGRLDVGQAAVVQEGLVLGVEGVEGTDGLIARCGALARRGVRPTLVKLAKPQQDTRVDLPTVGLSTVKALATAGFAGLVVEAGRTLVLDGSGVVALADRHGLFITAVTVS